MLLVALVAPALASAAERNAASTVTVQPKVLRLAEGGRAIVRVATPGEAPLITASIGRIQALREIGSGVFEAEYVPPDTLDPHVVLISAVTPSSFAWTALSLAGVREVELKARHRELVGVKVQGQQYGPVPADASGRAVLRIDVPPGVYSASAQGRAIELDVPRRSYAHVALDRAGVQASAREDVVVRVIAVGERGEPIAKPAVKLSVAEGSASAPRPVSPGVVAARWTVEPGGLRESKVTAQVTTRPAATASATLRRVSGAPAAVQVEVDRERLVAGDADELAVTARVVDAAGNPTDVPARLVVSLGSGSSARYLPDAVIDWQQVGGVYSGRVAVPRRRTGQVLELKVLAPNALVGSRTVELLAGPVTVVKVEPEEQLFADGQSRQLRVMLLDAHGNRASDDAAPAVTATRGKVGTPTRTAPGVYRVDYRSRIAAADYSEVVEARVGPLEGRTELRVRAMGGAVVFGVKGGYTRSTGGIGAPMAAAELGFWRRSLQSSLGLVVEVGYESFAHDETLTSGDVSLPVSSDASFLAIEPSVAWRRPLGGGMLWLGAGPGLARASSTVSAPGQPDLSSTSWVPSAHASAAWGLPLGPGIPFAELKVGWQGEADEAPVSGSLTSLTLNVGYRFDVL
jgi:hypothetical protein